mgnify:CR=1 FL=1
MANVGAVYPPEMWAARALMYLENVKIIANLVDRNFEDEVKEQGDIIHTRSRAAIGLVEKANNGSAVTFGAPDATDVAIELRYHTIAPFYITDRDIHTSIDTLVSDYIEPCVDPIADLVDQRLLNGDLAGYSTDGHGLLDTTLVGNTAVVGGAYGLATLAQTRADMRANKVPLNPGSVSVVMGTTHEGEATAQSEFIAADFTGEEMPGIRTGLIGNKLGMNHYASQNVQDLSGNARSVAFHRQAMALVTRPLAVPPDGMGVRGGNLERNGLGLRVVMSWDHNSFCWKISYDLLWGFRLLNGNLAQRITG